MGRDVCPGGASWAGEPAFVKREEGNGVYAIKMVGSSRGKFRIVGWKSLFKDGSFNKNVARGDGARVRGKARLEDERIVTGCSGFGTQEVSILPVCTRYYHLDGLPVVVELGESKCSHQYQ